MRTYPLPGSGREVGFEIDQVVFLSSLAAALRRTLEVTAVRTRPLFGRWGDVRVRFRFRGTECVVLEPFGDNARLWVVPADPDDTTELSALRRALEGTPTLLGMLGARTATRRRR